MSAFLIALMFGAGVSAWTYSKMGRRVGVENTRQILTIILVAGVVAFAFLFTLLKYVFNIQ